MERRTLLAVGLAFLVLYGYQVFFVPAPQPPAETAATEGQAQTAAPSGTAPTPAPVAQPAEPAAIAPQPTVDTLVGETSEREVVLETDAVQAVVTNRGGRVLHWRLKDYLDDGGQPVDLVPAGVPANLPAPFSLQLDDAALTERINTALYRVTQADPRTAVFEYQDSSGVSVRKEFRLDPSNYIVSFSARVARGEEQLNPTVLWGPGLGDVGATSAGGSIFTGNYVQPPQAIVNVAGDVTRLTPDDVTEQPVQEASYRFVGIDDHYFLAAAIDPGQVRAEFRPVVVPGEGETQRRYMTQSLRFASAPEGVRFFVGPKKDDLLRAIDIEMVKAIYFGIFAWLVRPLLNALNWVHGYVGNYGWSIIILTILINVVLFPLRHKSVVSMRKMQLLQPQMKAIQDRYKDLKMTDPARQKMNTEVMNLYREKGVNPAAGCVPILLTMPVLIAFYSLLSVAIELRGAPFIGWIHDLSRPDPYFVTPLLMGASMFWQTKVTPTTADPNQQKVMLIMPIIFTGMFLWFPSGLNIYYFTSNLWTIGQQYLTNRLVGPAVPPPPRPPAERRVKSVGAGKSTGAEKK